MQILIPPHLTSAFDNTIFKPLSFITPLKSHETSTDISPTCKYFMHAHKTLPAYRCNVAHNTWTLTWNKFLSSRITQLLSTCLNKMPTRCNRWFFTADLIACSTCFGNHYAHHQELESIIQVVAACGIWCFGALAATTCIILSSSWWWA